MKTKILFSLICAVVATSANAAIPYRVQRVDTATTDTANGYYATETAADKRFYVGGMYDFSMWDKFTDDENTHIGGKNTSSFEGLAGVRLYDIFRLEANYIRTNAKYDGFKLTGNTAMVNAIFDARIDNMYRLFHHQRLVPYVGVGGGLSFNSATDIHIDDKTTPVVAAMAGIGVEMGPYFTVDLGYRYFYMFSPKFDGMKDLSPTANQFRAGVRVNF